ncbi:MAG: sugar ABC transporter ATP-binding protein [Propioniciclava sp.]
MNTSTTTATPLVAMRGITKSFGRNEVLHGVDFTITAGSVHGLVGHNGAGKSTLMKTLAGLYSDYTGEVELDGTPVQLHSPGDSLGAGIAVIHQEFALVPALSVVDNLFLGHETHTSTGTLRKQSMRKQAAELLDNLGFDLPLEARVGRLPVGLQQLTEIAKAIGREARVLVMDEPTARLAPAEREALFRVTRQLAARGVGIVYISHFLDEVLDICDEVTILRDGSLVDHAPASSLTVTELSHAIVGQSAETFEATPWAASGAPVLELENFGPAGREGSHLTVGAGQIVGLAGLVGSGRTRLVEALCGAGPAAGTARLAGKPISFASPAEAAEAGVVLVPEDRKHRGLVLSSSITENVTLTALGRLFTRLGFVEARGQQQASDAAVERFNIRGAQGGGALARSLSGGNQQKVLIARVATAQPTVMILDQPTAGVDIGAKGEIYRHVQSLADDGVACIVVSDELEELLTLCTTVAVVRAGRVVTELPTAGLSPGMLLELMSVAGVDEQEDA